MILCSTLFDNQFIDLHYVKPQKGYIYDAFSQIMHVKDGNGDDDGNLDTALLTGMLLSTG